MSLLLPGVYTSLQLFVIIAIGFLGRRFGLIPEGFQKALSGFLVKIALPVYFFARFSATDLNLLKQGAWLPLAAIVVIGIGLVLGWLVFSFLPFKGTEKRAGIALAGFGNSGYIPLTIIEILPISIPLIAQEYDSSSAALFVGAFLIAFSPLLWSVGNSLISKKESRFSPLQLISPPMLGIFLGLIIPFAGLQPLLSNVELPFYYIHSALQRLGAAILPMVLVNLGVMIGSIRFHHTKVSRLMGMAVGVSLVRFLLLPGLFYLCYYTFLKDWNLHPAILLALFLETHTPSATNFSAMAVEAGVNEDLTAFTLLIAYVGYILLLPLFFMLFLRG